MGTREPLKTGTPAKDIRIADKNVVVRFHANILRFQIICFNRIVRLTDTFGSLPSFRRSPGKSSDISQGLVTVYPPPGLARM